MSSSAAIAEIVGLDLSYRQAGRWVRVLHEVSFAIARGEVFGLVGESGCGKSTLAYQLLGCRQPNLRIDGGSVLFKGENLLGVDRAALDRLRGNRISLVPQNPTTALSPGMRVGRQVAEVLQLHDTARSAADARRRVAELFGLVGLPDPAGLVERYPHELSGGQQQRVCIAMALACDPDLVVLDEPTTGLDVTTQDQIIGLLTDLRARLGMSMLYVTHDLGLLAQIADRVGVMYAGHMIEVAPTEALFARPRHPYTRGLIASVPQLDETDVPVGAPLRGLLRRDELPAGCPFQPRCDFSQPSCAIDRQQPELVAPGHTVACERWRDLAETPAVARDSPAPMPAVASQPVLRLDVVDIAYGGRGWLAGLFAAKPAIVVSDLSLAIQPGETFALVGESGSGKSTVARAISGLVAPLRGRIEFRGQPLPPSTGRRSADLRRRIQYIFQNPDASLNPRAKVGAILSRPLDMFFGLKRQEIERRVDQALLDVRLDAGYARRYPDELSGGERQRVAIARALVARPELLLCDEILSALDVSVQATIMSLLQDLRRNHKVAMLFISHDLAVVRTLADRVGVLFHGHLMQVGAVRDIFSPPFHPYTQELLAAAPRPRVARRAAVRSAEVRPAGGTGQGCVFAGRCPRRIEPLCFTTPPPWRTTKAGVRIRCHVELGALSRGADQPLSARP